jgi:hypothetical protein
MTFSIDRNVVRTIVRINAGWAIWALSLLASHLVLLVSCGPVAPVARIGGHALLIAVGAIAAAVVSGLLYRIASNVRMHRAAHASRSDLGVDYLAATVAALSLLGIIGTTMLSASSSGCSP